MEIDFAGRKGTLIELRQNLTYEGLLNGLPTVEGNQRKLEAIPKEIPADRYGVKPHLVPPTEQPIQHSDSYSFGTPSRLPGVRCIARFESVFPTSVGKGDGSGVTVV